MRCAFSDSEGYQSVSITRVNLPGWAGLPRAGEVEGVCVGLYVALEEGGGPERLAEH